MKRLTGQRVVAVDFYLVSLNAGNREHPVVPADFRGKLHAGLDFGVLWEIGALDLLLEFGHKLTITFGRGNRDLFLSPTTKPSSAFSRPGTICLLPCR